MKYVHIAVGAALLMYSLFNLPHFGIGEILVCSIFFPAPVIAWFLFKKDITGMLLAGMLLGITIEYITEIYWVYNLKVFIWKDISLFVVMGWGYNFTFYALLSRCVFHLITRSKASFDPDPKLIPLDLLLGPIWFLSNEFLGMKVLHLWTYSKEAGWTHLIPWLFDYPIEGVIGTVMISIVMPTVIRYWALALSVTGSVDHVQV